MHLNDNRRIFNNNHSKIVGTTIASHSIPATIVGQKRVGNESVLVMVWD